MDAACGTGDWVGPHFRQAGEEESDGDDDQPLVPHAAVHKVLGTEDRREPDPALKSQAAEGE